jgi:acyl CoA:acetate/3-ketoacid CoA transferase beta subunit
MSSPTRAEVCVVACAEAWRGDGAILASPMGVIPALGARLARLTFAPDLLLTDGDAYLLDRDGNVEGWLPYAKVFTMVAAGRRHVMMGAAQIDRYGNQNISCIGDWERPKAQLLGVRGAPGNTVNHAVSYWIPRHSRRVFVEQVDMVCGVGYHRGLSGVRGSSPASQHRGLSGVRGSSPASQHRGLSGVRGSSPASQQSAADLRVVVTNLAVFDFETPDRVLRLRSVHPGVDVSDVVKETGFEPVVPDEVAVSRAPSAAELELIRRLDPDGNRNLEVP